MDDGEPQCNLLKHPISISELIGPGSTIDMNTSFDEGIIHDIYDEIYGSDIEDDEVVVDQMSLVSPWKKSFSELKLQMIAVGDGIYKKIIVPGDVEKGLMAERSRVCVHYNTYWEGEAAPFDSTFLRGSAYSFYTGCGTVLEGLQAAARTMHHGEESQFVIPYNLLFGEMGCPPRIKPRADALFVIQMIAFNAVGDLDADQQMSAEDSKKYIVVVERVKQIHLKGLDFFGQGMFKNACRAFEKAVSVLCLCHLENEEEESLQQAFLLKLYTNLAVCYNKINLPRKTCIMCNEIRRLTRNKPSCKSVFQEGRAMLMLGEYERSRRLLIKAQHMEPQNKEISKELKDLENRFTSYKENQKGIWQKAMGFKDAKNTVDPTVDEEGFKVFKKSMIEVFEDFKNSSIKDHFSLPAGMSEKETEIVDELAKQFQMKMEFSPMDKVISIRK